jgi:hypothetical protein
MNLNDLLIVVSAPISATLIGSEMVADASGDTRICFFGRA